MAAQLHDYRGLAPFLISPLMEIHQDVYFFRTTLYLTRLSEALLRPFSKVDRIKLVSNTYRIIEISCKRIDLDGLIKKSKPLRKYEIEFITPICFRKSSPCMCSDF
ncbi:MAG: hypothetical protein QXF02_06595 [Candidatus Korarchaeota archaeon]